MKSVLSNKGLFIHIILSCLSLFSYSQTITQSFNYTGSAQSFTVPPNVCSITVQAWGGAGGGGGGDTYSGSDGGGGAYATSVIPVTAGQVLTIVVGGGGGAGPAVVETRSGKP